MFSRTETFAMPENLPFPIEVVLQTIKSPSKMMMLNSNCVSVTQSATDPSIWTLETKTSWFGGLLTTPSRYEAKSKQNDDGAEYTVEAALGVKTVAIWTCKAMEGPPDDTPSEDQGEGWTELTETAVVTAPFPLIGMVTSLYRKSHEDVLKGLLDLLRVRAPADQSQR